MQARLLYSIVLFVLAPLCAGLCVYAAAGQGLVHHLIRDYLPDLLWSFSLFNALRIIWNYKLPLSWLVAAIGLGVVFELLQYSGAVQGTFDYMDILTYLSGAGLAFTYQPKIKTKLI